MIFFSILLYTSVLSSKTLIKYELVNPLQSSFKFKEACRFVIKDKKTYLPLIEKNDSTSIDCMGNKLDVIDFCKSKSKTNNEIRNFARAIIDEKEKKVLCQSAEIVISKLNCSSKKLTDLCFNTKKSCESLKKYLANQLDVIHHSKTKSLENSFSTLNCFYQNKKRKVEGI